MLDFIVGTFILVIALLGLAIMSIYFLKLAGPTESAWLNTYSLLRRGGWRELLKGLTVTAVALVVTWFLLAL